MWKKFNTLMRAFFKLTKLLALVIKAVVVVHVQFRAGSTLSPQQKQEKVHAWAHQVLSALGVQLTLTGATPPQQGPLLLVANHVSWLDIVVLLACTPARFISKAELHRWPLLGSMIAGAGTLFIERESNRDVMRVVHHMKEALMQNHVLTVFPEGTTSDGETVLPFHGNLIQAAISAHCPIQSIALRYLQPASVADNHFNSHGKAKVNAMPQAHGTWSLCKAVAYVGDDHLLGSVWRIVSTSSILARLDFAVPERAEGRSRREWANDLRNSVLQRLDR